MVPTIIEDMPKQLSIIISRLKLNYAFSRNA